MWQREFHLSLQLAVYAVCKGIISHSRTEHWKVQCSYKEDPPVPHHLSSSGMLRVADWVPDVQGAYSSITNAKTSPPFPLAPKGRLEVVWTTDDKGALNTLNVLSQTQVLSLAPSFKLDGKRKHPCHLYWASEAVHPSPAKIMEEVNKLPQCHKVRNY